MKYIYIVSVIGLLLSIISCNDSDYQLQNLVPEDSHKIVYFRDAIDQKVNMSFYADTPQYDDSLVVVKAGSDPSLTANLTFETMSQNELDENYSIPEGIAYKLLPQDTYAFVDEVMQLGPGETTKYFRFSVYPSKIFVAMKSNPDVTYVLPIQIKSVADSVNVNKDTYFFVYDVSASSFVKFANTDDVTGTIVYQEVDVPIGARFENSTNNNDFSCSMKTADNAQALADNYNSQHGTDYILLPDGSFHLDDFFFNKGTFDATATLHVAREYLISDVTYILPVQLNRVSSSEILVDVDNAVKYVIISNPKYGTIISERNDFKILFCNSDNKMSRNSSSDNNGVMAILDDDWNTYWHSNYSDTGWWNYSGTSFYRSDITSYWAFEGLCNLPTIVIDLGKVRRVTGIGLLKRYMAELKDCQNMKVYISNDSQFNFELNRDDYETVALNNWSLLFDLKNIPDANEILWYDIEDPGNAPEVRFIKIRMGVNNRGDHLAVLAEFYVKELGTIDGNKIE